MAFQRIVQRKLPGGDIAKVYPFHLSLQGMKDILICRDEEDYDHLEKSFYLGALANNALVVSEIAMSTHGHCALLATRWEVAADVGEHIKKRHSQYLSRKYGDHNVLARTRISVQYLDSDRYVRNALAYIPRNASETGTRIEDYRWSSYRGMFVGGRCQQPKRKVSALTRRERQAVFHTNMDLRKVPWILDADDRIEPASACDYTYLESAFSGDQTFFLRLIGEVSPSQMRQKLVINGREWQADSEFLLCVADVSSHWYRKDIEQLTRWEKAKLIPYLFRCYRTSPAQLARCTRSTPTEVKDILRLNGISVK